MQSVAKVSIFALLFLLSCKAWVFDGPPEEVIPLEVLPRLTAQNVKPEYAAQIKANAVWEIGKPLDPGTYTYYFKNCPYDRRLYTINQIGQYEVLTDSILFVEGESWIESDIRIICSDSLGFTSFAGMDIFKLKEDHYTTSLGKEYNPSYVEYATRHELWGHLFNAMIHEHHNREGGGINWNYPYLYNDFKNRLGMDRNQVDDWVNYVESEIYQKTDYNGQSFMGYLYDCAYTVDGKNCGTFNYYPSKVDMAAFWKNHGNGIKDVEWKL